MLVCLDRSHDCHKVVNICDGRRLGSWQIHVERRGRKKLWEVGTVEKTELSH